MRIRFVVVLVFLQLAVMFFSLQSVSLAAQNDGNDLTSSIWAKAVLEVPGAPVTLIWKMVGADITPSGDQVISGYFYADPNDFAYGSIYNPELFVKIYIATNGWCNIAFNHVTVDSVTVYSAHHYAGTAQQTGSATLANRLVEHQYNGVSIDTTLQSSGGTSIAASETGYTMTSDLWAKAILQPVTGAINLIWKEVGSDITPSGDTVVSGYFYARPDDFAYGSAYNPEVFVKIYIASNGWANIAFNHVTVDDVALLSAHHYTGLADQSATATLNGRLVEHQYDGVVASNGGGSVPGTVVGASGGTVIPSQGSELSPSTVIVVPPNAVSEEVSIGLVISETSAGTLDAEADAATVTAIMADVMDRCDEEYLHPMYTPAAIFAGGTNVGLKFAMTPDGIQFSQPVSLEIPLNDISLQSDDVAIVLLKGADGVVDVLPDVQMTSDTLKVTIFHFSDVSLWNIVKNTFSFAYTSLVSFPKDKIEQAKQTVGSFVANVNDAILGNYCKSKKNPFLNTGMLPTYTQLLNNLARSEGEIGGDTLALQNPLMFYIKDAHQKGLPPMTMSEILNKSIELTDGDAFKALVLAHEVLRSDRFDKTLKDMIADVRGDSSDDEVGARYHLLGTAIYGFWYEHMQNQPDPSKLLVPPNLASLLEEAFVSGDIYSDPGEYVVDIAGAELGRKLYKATVVGCENGSFEFSINIPGYSGPFEKKAIFFSMAMGSDGISYPSVSAASATENFQPTEDDVVSLVFSRNLTAPGNYTLDDTWVSNGGAVEMFFSSHEIMEVMANNFKWPVGFSQTGGNLMLENYGTANGDRLKGTFSMTVEGIKGTCHDIPCDVYTSDIIIGTINGSFDGIIKENTGN